MIRRLPGMKMMDRKVSQLALFPVMLIWLILSMRWIWMEMENIDVLSASENDDKITWYENSGLICNTGEVGLWGVCYSIANTVKLNL